MAEEKKKLVPFTRPVVEEEVPDLYINSVSFLTSQYEFLFSFGLKSDPKDDPRPVVNIRMSPQHAKVMMAVLRKNVRQYEKQIGEIKLVPKMIEDLGIQEDI